MTADFSKGQGLQIKPDIKELAPQADTCFLQITLDFAEVNLPKNDFMVSGDDFVVIAGDGQKIKPYFIDWLLFLQTQNLVWSNVWSSVGFKSAMPLLYCVPIADLDKVKLVVFGREIPLNVKLAD
jgi:hypothetical protein